MSLFAFIICIIYSLAGTSAFVAFLILQYYWAAVYGFITGSVSSITAHVIWLHRKNRLNLWYDTEEIKRMFWFAFFIFLLSTGFLTFHVAMMALLKQITIPFIILVVWALITMKAGLTLMYFAHKFTNETISHQLDPPLIPQANIH